MMRPLSECPAADLAAVRFVLTDIDDTLTDDGQLRPEAYQALWRLDAAGIRVVPVTGRPAGWCDMIARFWPVAAVVGENGALTMAYDRGARKMTVRHWLDAATRAENRARLDALAARILAAVPGCALASDQAYREADLAIDFCEDVAPLPPEAVRRIVALFEAAGAVAKVSSIHVNGWFGVWDKLAMSKRLFAAQFGLDLDSPADQAKVAYAGDSPNDQPMFGFFPLAVGVANVRRYLDQLTRPPAYVTEGEGGHGFVELADRLIRAAS